MRSLPLLFLLTGPTLAEEGDDDEKKCKLILSTGMDGDEPADEDVGWYCVTSVLNADTSLFDADDDKYLWWMDCDDEDGNVNPGMVEDCTNGTDDDCDGLVDGDDNVDYEVCDDIDNDCDGDIDAADSDLVDGTDLWVDLDGDGYGGVQTADTCDPAGISSLFALQGGDCNDDDDDNFPYNTEICDGQDNDCDGLVDDNDDTGPGAVVVSTTLYLDADGDGFGDLSEPFDQCDGDGLVSNHEDCDDGEVNVNPDALEVCDGQDNDCDALVDEAAVETTLADGSEDFCLSATTGCPWTEAGTATLGGASQTVFSLTAAAISQAGTVLTEDVPFGASDWTSWDAYFTIQMLSGSSDGMAMGLVQPLANPSQVSGGNFSFLGTGWTGVGVEFDTLDNGLASVYGDPDANHVAIVRPDLDGGSYVLATAEDGTFGINDLDDENEYAVWVHVDVDQDGEVMFEVFMDPTPLSGSAAVAEDWGLYATTYSWASVVSADVTGLITPGEPLDVVFGAGTYNGTGQEHRVDSILLGCPAE